jgi:ribosome maturation protein SDO1
MVTIDKAVPARINKKGKEFEILVDPELAQKARDELKKGSDADVSDVLAVEAIFLDSKKGIRAGKKDLLPAFDTDDVTTIAKSIIRDGRLYTTSEQRDKGRQEKWDRIVALISINAIDPRSKLPIPKKSIEDALHKAFFRSDERKVEDQLPDAIKAVKKIIPLSFHQKTLQFISIPANVAGRCRDVCKNLGSVKEEIWGVDRSLTITVEIPAGLTEELIDKVNALTHGTTEMKILER